VFSDNDSLAALCSRSFGAEVLLLLTDVAGVFDRPPSDPSSTLLPLYRQATAAVAIGEKSAQGRGGMASKIAAAEAAVAPGAKTSACVVAAGSDLPKRSDVFRTKPGPRRKLLEHKLESYKHFPIQFVRISCVRSRMLY
jgi:glutamate 5-kinase